MRNYPIKKCVICKRKYKPRSAVQKYCDKCVKFQNTSSRYYQAHLTERREWNRIYHLNKRHQERKEILEFLGGKCTKCSVTDTRVLQIDHINGGGNKDRIRFGRRKYEFYSYIKKHKNKFQLLCANCNWIKKYENNEHGTPYARPRTY